MRRMQCLESFTAGICGIRNTEAEYRSWYSRLLPENQRTLSARVWRRHYTERFHLTVLPDWNVLQPVHLHISFSMEWSLPSVWNMSLNLWIWEMLCMKHWKALQKKCEKEAWNGQSWQNRNGMRLRTGVWIILWQIMETRCSKAVPEMNIWSREQGEFSEGRYGHFRNSWNRENFSQKALR